MKTLQCSIAQAYYWKNQKLDIDNKYLYIKDRSNFVTSIELHCKPYFSFDKRTIICVSLWRNLFHSSLVELNILSFI
jgi:hypothetical protein